MHTSLLLVALLTPAQSADSPGDALRWQPNYAAAKVAGRDQGKPLAVFLGSGSNGWQKLTAEGMSAEARKTLADNYVCCYVDVSEPQNASLARALRMENGPGLVLSTRDGTSQAFWHNGVMSAGDLDNSLRRHANGAMVASTETLSSPRVSYTYDPSANSAAQALSAPMHSVMTAHTPATPGAMHASSHGSTCATPVTTHAHCSTCTGHKVKATCHSSCAPAKHSASCGSCSGGRQKRCGGGRCR